MAEQAPEPPVRKKLYVSRTDKRIAGVCGGIAAYLEVDPTLIRLAWVVGTVITGFIPGVIAYAIAALIMPKEAVESGG